MTEGDHGRAAREGSVDHADPSRRVRGRTRLLVVAAAVVVSGSIASAAVLSAGHRAAAPTAPATARSHGSQPTDLQRAERSPASLQQSAAVLSSAVTLVARMKGTFPGYSEPGGRVDARVPATWQGLPSALPVIATAPDGWLRVRLAQRPDESTAWIRSSDATLSTTPYRIVVNLKTTHLQLFKSNRLVYDFPAGVGASYTPTPIGQYFVAFIEPPLGPEYGAFIMITSAHSRAITSWDGTGDAIIGIHGPIGADAEIGTTGAYISNGCVRLHDADLLKLAQVPPGSPIDIVG